MISQRFRGDDGTKINTVGDGFLASFDGPAGAIRCPMAIVDGITGLGQAGASRTELSAGRGAGAEWERLCTLVISVRHRARHLLRAMDEGGPAVSAPDVRQFWGAGNFMASYEGHLQGVHAAFNGGYGERI